MDDFDNMEFLQYTLQLFLSYQILDDGTIFEQKGLVDEIGTVKIKIQSNDHNPPHFHIESSDCNASFLISDCTILAGNCDKKLIKKIEYWYDQKGRYFLIEEWNRVNQFKPHMMINE